MKMIIASTRFGIYQRRDRETHQRTSILRRLSNMPLKRDPALEQRLEDFGLESADWRKLLSQRGSVDPRNKPASKGTDQSWMRRRVGTLT